MRITEDKKQKDADHDHEHGHDGGVEKGHKATSHGDHSDHDHEHGEHGEHGEHEHGEGAHHETAAKDPSEYSLEDGQSVFLNKSHLFHHVQDSYSFEFPKFLCTKNEEGIVESTAVAVPNLTFLPKGYGKTSKFMFLELIAALILCGLFIWLAKKMKKSDRPKGRSWNLLETFVVFIRDDIAKPTIGNDYKRFLPFLLTLFFFILALNLLGMIPFLGSATGALPVTVALALCVFGVVAGSGVQKMGAVGFLKAQVPHMDLPFGMEKVMIPLMFVIEIFGFLVKHAVLAIRLFANMLAGHLVLAIFVAFIGVVSVSAPLFWVVAPASVFASIAFSLLEVFVAFLQAYVFTFLASLFIGSAQHAH